jgi:hypothetical protein
VWGGKGDGGLVKGRGVCEWVWVWVCVGGGGGAACMGSTGGGHQPGLGRASLGSLLSGEPSTAPDQRACRLMSSLRPLPPAENTKSPHVSRALKTLVHPGEVNRIREVPQHPHVLITHTDAPELHVWNTDSQPDRAGVKVRCWPRGWVPGRCAAERAALLWSAGGCRAPCRHSSRHPTASTLSPTRRAPLPSSSQSQTLC